MQMTIFFDKASELVFKTGGDLSEEQMEEFEFFALGFSIEEKDNAELDLRSVIEQRQMRPDAKVRLTPDFTRSS
tara:strand:+ start:1178 stop:1399 length:222 start_codon:yes stop_codon:yes gene_type:complete